MHPRLFQSKKGEILDISIGDNGATSLLRIACRFSRLVGRMIDSRCIVVAWLLYVHGKHIRSCRDGQLT